MRSMMLRRPVILSAGQTMRIDPGPRDVDGIIISVTTGVLDVYVGEHTGGPDSLPDWRCVPEIRYQYDFPAAKRFITVLANQDVNAVVWLLGP